MKITFISDNHVRYLVPYATNQATPLPVGVKRRRRVAHPCYFIASAKIEQNVFESSSQNHNVSKAEQELRVYLIGA